MVICHLFLDLTWSIPFLSPFYWIESINYNTNYLSVHIHMEGGESLVLIPTMLPSPPRGSWYTYNLFKPIPCTEHTRGIYPYITNIIGCLTFSWTLKKGLSQKRDNIILYTFCVEVINMCMFCCSYCDIWHKSTEILPKLENVMVTPNTKKCIWEVLYKYA